MTPNELFEKVNRFWARLDMNGIDKDSRIYPIWITKAEDKLLARDFSEYGNGVKPMASVDGLDITGIKIKVIHIDGA